MIKTANDLKSLVYLKEIIAQKVLFIYQIGYIGALLWRL